MLNRFGRTRPNASGFGAPRGCRPKVTSQATPAPQNNSSVQAQYKPDFLAPSQSAQTNDQTSVSPAPSSITTSYQQARAALADPLQHSGPMTEKQTRELKWLQREDPKAFRDQMVQNQQIYGNQLRQNASQPPSNRANFNGPSKRFGL